MMIFGWFKQTEMKFCSIPHTLLKILIYNIPEVINFSV